MSEDDFEWDATKAEANHRKHGVDFETAMEVFDDPFAIEEPDLRQRNEERLLITGMVRGALFTVVHTERAERIRIISARPATRREHDDYYSQKTHD
jgi:hypothetical protein